MRRRRSASIASGASKWNGRMAVRSADGTPPPPLGATASRPKAPSGAEVMTPKAPAVAEAARKRRRVGGANSEFMVILPYSIAARHLGQRDGKPGKPWTHGNCTMVL